MKLFRHLIQALLLIGSIAFAATSFAHSKVEVITVHGTSLEGNLAGDSPDREVHVYLPASYGHDEERRYPVAYLLHGYSLTAEGWMEVTSIKAGADAMMTEEGGVQEMILVSPDAYNRYAGAMYGASVTTGDWEHFIAEDLVNYIDANYRTIADREHRALSGHSMGGYGTMRIGMKFPQTFSVLYAMSSCCLADVAGNEAGTDEAAAMTPEQVDAMDSDFQKVLHARAATWSANPDNPPLYMDFPYTNGEPNPEVRARWFANSVNALVDQYSFNLKRYTAIKLDIGDADTLYDSNVQLDSVLTRNGVSHEFEVYEGDHVNRVPERFEQFVLPFIGEHL